ncbi:VOC family protein [Chungangia koreensis]|uniref:VOC family protein n=1 Tax=Chungangia koreensis TaxID=752657 RepID=A0ABV8X026_9LACT
MHSPISNQINTIFVHVSDLKNSVEWYSKLLGQEFDLSIVSRPVYNMTINDHTGLTLDAGPEGERKEFTPIPYPLFNFHTNEIDQAYEYMGEMDFSIESEIVRFEDFSYFIISDPDGNQIMICTG